MINLKDEEEDGKISRWPMLASSPCRADGVPIPADDFNWRFEFGS